MDGKMDDKKDLRELLEVEAGLEKGLAEVLAKSDDELTDEDKAHIIEAPILIERIRDQITIAEKDAEIASLKEQIRHPIGFASTGNGARRTQRTESPYERGRKYARELFERNGK